MPNANDSIPMKRFLAGPIMGALLSLILVLNTLILAVPLYLFVLLKVIGPDGRWRDVMTRVIVGIAQFWNDVNTTVAVHALPTAWELRINAELDPKTSYMVTSNHQSWVDIFVLFEVLSRRVPFLRFFLKQELRKIPVLGTAWWALDYPFMKRHSKAELEANPELRGKDLETTRQSCEQFRGKPVSVLNFLEGTRYSESKYARQASPYRHLLKPKAGGLAFALSAMGDQLHSLVNVTIAYPEGCGELWDFLCGRIPRIVVQVDEVEIPPAFRVGDYQNDMAFRDEFQAWVTALWEEKDELLDTIKGAVTA